MPAIMHRCKARFVYVFCCSRMMMHAVAYSALYLNTKHGAEKCVSAGFIFCGYCIYKPVLSLQPVALVAVRCSVLVHVLTLRRCRSFPSGRPKGFSRFFQDCHALEDVNGVRTQDLGVLLVVFVVLPKEVHLHELVKDIVQLPQAFIVAMQPPSRFFQHLQQPLDLIFNLRLLRLALAFPLFESHALPPVEDFLPLLLMFFHLRLNRRKQRQVLTEKVKRWQRLRDFIPENRRRRHRTRVTILLLVLNLGIFRARGRAPRGCCRARSSSIVG
mmetsp:Transcript_21218/g.39784  ORF Transcript_21218/g.39784 Transcript_21218/m.39784 type:complete len:272 (+) Transcript_21218:44-859(+)